MERRELVQEIPVTEIKGLHIGNAQDQEAKTGVTVLLFDQGARVGVDISGGGPASRETPLALPLTADNPINAIVFSGGSAYGLAAADGVMRYLEERGIGYDTGYAKIPLVCQSCIYDLGYGRPDVRPDSAMGYAACVDAESKREDAGQRTGAGQDRNAEPCAGVSQGRNVGQNLQSCGSIGAGTGATVGKLLGMARAMKSGLGIYGAALGELKMAAVVVVNAVGDIFDPKNGRKIAGLRTEDGQGFSDTCQELYQISQRTDLFNSNTTIGAVVTNGTFSKAEMNKIASMARNAYARCINPVGTMADGDTIYAAATGEVEADVNVAGTLAAQVMAEAIVRAVSCAEKTFMRR